MIFKKERESVLFDTQKETGVQKTVTVEHICTLFVYFHVCWSCLRCVRMNHKALPPESHGYSLYHHSALSDLCHSPSLPVNLLILASLWVYKTQTLLPVIHLLPQHHKKPCSQVLYLSSLPSPPLFPCLSFWFGFTPAQVLWPHDHALHLVWFPPLSPLPFLSLSFFFFFFFYPHRTPLTTTPTPLHPSFCPSQGLSPHHWSPFIPPILICSS